MVKDIEKVFVGLKISTSGLVRRYGTFVKQRYKRVVVSTLTYVALFAYGQRIKVKKELLKPWKYSLIILLFVT
jgi:hypothetical protein